MKIRLKMATQAEKSHKFCKLSKLPTSSWDFDPTIPPDFGLFVHPHVGFLTLSLKTNNFLLVFSYVLNRCLRMFSKGVNVFQLFPSGF